MIKPQKLNKGDKVAIVSLSRGMLGKDSCKHELDLAIKRLKEMGLVPVIMDNSLKSNEHLSSHPEERAADLKQAFMDDSIKGIITAIGGNDTYKLIPYLMEDEEFVNAVRNKPKIFVGYSDTTGNHLMLNKIGLSTFYGPCLLIDIAELDHDMLPYTRKYFEKFFEVEDTFEIESSPVWYKERMDYGETQLGVPRVSYKEEHGYEVLSGNGVVNGQLYGGCLESVYDALVGNKNAAAPEIYRKYNILPTDEEWLDKILFLETSELLITPQEFRTMMVELKNRRILELVQGVIIAKPMDEIYYEEYKDVLKDIFSDINTPVLYNVNFGHAAPRCILPYDADTIVDFDNKKIIINSPILEYGMDKAKKL